MKINSRQITNVLAVIAIFALAIVPLTGFAQSDDIFGGFEPGDVPQLESETQTLSDLITKILRVLLSIVGLVAVVFLVWGGFKYMSSQGDEEKTGDAKKTIVNALIGVVIVILAYALVVIVYNVVSGREIV